MIEYREITKTIEVPKGTGLTGFMLAISNILRQPRIQEVTITARGKVSYRRFARQNEPDEEIKLDFESVMPWAILRNTNIEELPSVPRSANAAVVLGQMFAAAARDHLHPVAMVGGSASVFWEWYGQTTGIVLGKDEAYGLPFLNDENIPNDVLILCAAYGRGASLVDTQQSYKIAIPAWRLK